MVLKVVEIIATAHHLQTGKISSREPSTLWWRFSFPCLTFFAYAKITVIKSLWSKSQNGTIHKAVAQSKMKSTCLMIAAVVVLNVFCWAPILVLQLLEVYRVFENRSFENAFLIYIWCVVTQISSSSLSPVIHAFLSTDFNLRRNVLKHCCFCCSRHVSTGGLHCLLSGIEPVIWHGRISAENQQKCWGV